MFSLYFSSIMLQANKCLSGGNNGLPITGFESMRPAIQKLLDTLIERIKYLSTCKLAAKGGCELGG
jgi:hypothetical protein